MAYFKRAEFWHRTGFSPLYTFLASLRQLTEIRGRVLHYEQWNIDPQSVVSFAGLEFVEKKKD